MWIMIVSVMRLLSVLCTILKVKDIHYHGHPDIILPVFATIRSESHVECFHPVLKGAFKGTNAGKWLVQATLTDGAFRWNNIRSRDLDGLFAQPLIFLFLLLLTMLTKPIIKLTILLLIYYLSISQPVKRNCLEGSTQMLPP